MRIRTKFKPKEPVTDGGESQPHNNAKRKLAEAVERHDRKPSLSAKKRHSRRMKKEFHKVYCGRKNPGAFKSMFCQDADGLRADRIPKNKRFPLEQLKLVESSWDNSSQGVLLIGKDEEGQKDIIAIRLPRQNSNKCAKKLRSMRATFENALCIKNDISRGKNAEGPNDRYVIFGYRKKPDGSDIGEYAFKPDASAENKKCVTEEVASYVESMEELVSPYICPEDRCSFAFVREMIDLPSASGAATSYSTQFSLGKNYWSPVHNDDDYFWTMLSVLDQHGSCKPNKVLQWFTFPEYGVAVPLCAGDILVFNPQILHSATNHTEEDTYIYSAYVSSKTVAARGANALS